MSAFEEILKAPDCCYVEGCQADNEIVLHLSDEPPRLGDFCREHARGLADTTPLVWTCDCVICDAARRDLALHQHPDGVVLCVDCLGRWIVITASGSTHLLDLDAKTVQRVQDSSNARATRDRAASVPLRRDCEVLPLLHFDPIRLDQSAALLIGDVDDYEGYVNTTRVTTPVRSVERAQ